MKRCSRCLLPETYPGIRFDQQGVCNFCPPPGRSRTVPRLGHERLCSTIDPYRRSGSGYDCLVALSGGRDSTYLLYYAVKVLGLRVLAFTIDNGFMPQQTRENIEKATHILGVDHVIEHHGLVRRNVKPVLEAWLRRPSAAMVSFLCTGCRLGLYRGFLRAARRHQTPLVLSGLGEPESNFATLLLYSGWPRGTRGLLAGLGTELAANPWYLLLSPGFPLRISLEYLYAGNLYGISSRDVMKKLLAPAMRHVKFFEYIPWDEAEITSTIGAELDWRNYEHSESTWRSDCRVNLLKNHLYYETLGFSKNDVMVSSLIRLGVLSREEGLARVRRENVISETFLRELFDDVGVSFSAYQKALATMRARREAGTPR